MDEKWDEELLPGIRRRDIYNFYLQPDVEQKILNDIIGRDVIVRQVFRPGQTTLRRHPSRNKDERIRITKSWENPDDPNDYLYWISRRTVELHRTTGNETDELIFDIDPGGKVSLDTVKAVVKTLKKTLDDQPSIINTEVRYSGGRGFYVIAKMKNKMPVTDARQLAKDFIAGVDMIHPDVTVYSSGLPPRPNEIKIDLAPMKRGGSIRALYSLNADTGRLSMPVNNIDTFNPEDADFRNFKNNLQEVIKFR